MKKLLLIIGLIAFIGSYVAPTAVFAQDVAKAKVENKKCEKCGKEDCDGTCSVQHKCNHDAKADGHKCTHSTDANAGAHKCSKSSTEGSAHKCAGTSTAKCCDKSKTEAKSCCKKTTEENK